MTARTRSAIVLPVLLAIVVAIVLMTPQTTASDREGSLTTYSASPGGARGIYEIARRLGWPTARRRTPFAASLDTAAVYLVLDPPISLTQRESDVLLGAVRRGAGLVYVVGSTPGLDAALHLSRSNDGHAMTDRPPRAACPARDTPTILMWFDDTVHLYRLIATAPLADADTVPFVHVAATPMSPRGVAAVGLSLGAGRVVALADPDLLRNDVVRVCHWGVGVADVAMLDWVSAGQRPTLVFDEYHQGHGEAMETVTGLTWNFLTRTVLGRIVAQGIVAACILLLAMGIRPIAPRAVRPIERRSPLEHVEALAQAYAAVGASAIATRRLIHGLRRRHGHGTWLGGTPVAPGDTVDDRFLAAAAARYDNVAADVARVLDAENRRVSARELVGIAEAVERIDRALDRPPVVPLSSNL